MLFSPGYVEWSEVMFTLTLHVLGSQFLLQQFDLREGEGNEDKIKVKRNQVNSQVFTVTSERYQ